MICARSGNAAGFCIFQARYDPSDAPLMSPVEACAERLDDIGRQALRLRALSRTRPHVFLEDKQELAKSIFALATEIRRAGRLPERSGRFEAGTIAASGRLVRVERRGHG